MFGQSQTFNPAPMQQMERELEAAQADLDAAQHRVDKAYAAITEAQLSEIDDSYRESYDRMMGMSDEAFVADAPGFDERPYVLPFGNGYAKFNPHSPEDIQEHNFGATWFANMTAIICKKDERSRPTRLIWTSGYAGVGDDHDKIGQRFQARHDQTNGNLGIYEIVGLAFYGPDSSLARTVGDVPNIKFAQSTYK